MKKIIQFLTTEIWRMRLAGLSKRRSFFIRQLRIILIALRGFNEDKCLLSASALTFYSLLSIVPVLAMFFGIAKGFGMDALLEEKIMSIEGYNYDVLIKLKEFAHSMLDNTKGGVVAGVGIVVLFWSVMKVLGNIESSFNDIWEIRQQRSYTRKFSDYLSIMLIAPILFIVSSSITGYVKGMVEYIMEHIALVAFFEPLITLALRLIPYLLIWLLMTFIYMVMPNTKVNFKSAAVGGVIAGTIFQLAEILYFSFQVGVAQYNAIYGSFAALPLFLIWLQTSWMIVLFGAEISFANQNVGKYEFEEEARNINNRYKMELAVFIMVQFVRRFQKGEGGYTATELSVEHSIPIRLTRQIIFELAETNLLAELRKEVNEEVSYQPARDISELTIHDVVTALEKRGAADIPVKDDPQLTSIRQAFDKFESSLRGSSFNTLLKKL